MDLKYLSGFRRWKRHCTAVFRGIVVRADHADLIQEYFNPALARNRIGLEAWAERQANPPRSLDPDEDERLYA